MHRYPQPNLHDLLLPVIACLPTAFFSPQPPPALLPLLSPILRQRVSILSQSASNTRSNTYDDNWLNLLTWSPERAERLREICGSLQLEPHPVSGELELFEDVPDDEAGKIEYRQLDAETLQAKCDVTKLNLSVVWAWCTNDTGGIGAEALVSTTATASDGWRIAEVRSLEGTEKEEWHASQGEAETATEKFSARPDPSVNYPTPPAPRAASTNSDDDYWASYDRTPASRTPAKHSPAPRQSGFGSGLNPLTTSSAVDNAEHDYFARYGTEVQPAMDNHDPEEEGAAQDAESTLDQAPPSTLDPRQRTQQQPPTPPEDAEASSKQAQEARQLHSPTPSRPHSPSALRGDQGTGGSQVERLETAASASTAAEVGVKQHISTEMKSLYRLARAAGIEREEFERVIGRELEVLGMLD